MAKSNGDDNWAVDMGWGCLVDVLALVALFFALGEDRMVTVCAYAILLSFVSAGLRWFLVWLGAMEGPFGHWLGRAMGPAFLALAVVLSYVHPLETESGEGGKEPATPANIGAAVADKIADAMGQDGAGEENGEDNGEKEATKPHWEGEVPPGVRYTAADESVTLEDALAELNGLIGLGAVKAEVEKFAKFIKVAQMRQAEGLKVAPIAYHMVFTGNPGTGKTTVARIMAKIYRALGVVKNGHLVETDRGGLIAQYVGQTAIKTGNVIDFALDGVLFIDEAYAITEGGEQGYGGECIATLLKRMEDDRDRLVVIVAGYPEEMKRFIDSNPGLESRFTRYIHFPDYTAEELAAIFRQNAKKNQYVLSEDVERWLDPAMALWTKDRDRKFGNGRYVRNLFEKTVERQAMRVAEMENPTREDLMTLTMKDVGIELKDPDASDED
jgi:Holliday junction resolvasome RuvABC ATP-dependent DNA helicase subunit